MTERPQENIVSIAGLGKRFGDFVALRDINLEIRQGEVLTFLGPSGCGKSTLMRIIAGFEAPTEGALRLHDQDMVRMPPERRPVNMVFQRYALFPHLDVFDNIAFGLRLKKLPEKEVRAKVQAMMKLVQLEHLASRWISQISGGQSQRVALARALVNQPEVLLLDEPLAALDLKIRHHMLTELQRIQRATGITFVYVTHDQDEAMILSNRIVLMDHGIIEQIGTPDDLYFRPQSLFAAKFLGDTNIVPGKIVERQGDGALARFGNATTHGSRVASQLRQGDDVLISVRPEAIAIRPSDAQANGSAAPNACRATLRSITPIGGRVVYGTELDDGTVLRAQQPRANEAQALAIGQPVELSWRPDVIAILPK